MMAGNAAHAGGAISMVIGFDKMMKTHQIHRRSHSFKQGIDTDFFAPASDDYFGKLLAKIEVGLSEYLNGQK